MKLLKWFIAFWVSAMIGCASSGVIPMDKGTFVITKKSAQIGFGPPVGLKGDVYKEANDYCSQTSRDVETIDFQMVNSGFARPGSVQLQFRCVDKEPARKTTSVAPKSDEQ